jgi:hypothetical protein
VRIDAGHLRRGFDADGSSATDNHLAGSFLGSVSRKVSAENGPRACRL